MAWSGSIRTDDNCVVGAQCGGVQVDAGAQTRTICRKGSGVGVVPGLGCQGLLWRRLSVQAIAGVVCASGCVSIVLLQVW